MKKILLIEDDVLQAQQLSLLFKKKGFEVQSYTNGKTALRAFGKGSFDLVFSDYSLPDMTGVEIIRNIKKQSSDIPVIIYTGYTDVKTAVHVMKVGAFDYLIKPLAFEEVILVVNRAIEINNRSLSNDSGGGPSEKDKSVHKPPNSLSESKQNFITGKSNKSLNVQKQVELVAKTNYSVIVYGESGTGKESIAYGIHKLSKRKEKPFIAVDCGALTNELSGSELFGHEKGAFTGAYTTKPGQFEMAAGGTIFLDEIGNLSYDIQTSLLRAVQERKIRRLGSQKETFIDVRIILASNRNLEDLVEEGKFREDLYHRLNEFSIYLPPLRDRNEDLLLFADHFLKLVNQELKKNITGISNEAVDILLHHKWPGNLRELNNVIRRAALITEEETITPESLPRELMDQKGRGYNSKERPDKANIFRLDTEEDLKSAAHRVEEAKIRQTLRMTNNNKSKAAKILGIDRKTLYNKLHEYGIKV